MRWMPTRWRSKYLLIMARLLKLIVFLAACAPCLGATGSWNGVAFTGWNGVAITAWNATAISAASAASPAFGAEIQRGNQDDSTATTVITLASGIAQHSRVIVCVTWQSASQTASTVTDGGGNTYAKDKEIYGVNGGNINMSLFSANATTALSASSTITITWGSPAFTRRQYCVITGTGIAASSAVDQTASGASFGTSPSATASTATANTLLVGFVTLETQARTYGSGAWTAIGAAQTWSGTSGKNYFFYKVASATGSQNPGGTISASSDTWGMLWVAYK